MENPDIRWRQRFQNFEKAFFQLGEFIQKRELNKFEEQGLIKCFEYSYELAWNLMKDYLVYQGTVGITGSRDAIRQAFSRGLIQNGERWMEMVNDRILTVHTYDETTAEKVVQNIIEIYFDLFSEFYNTMKNLI